MDRQQFLEETKLILLDCFSLLPQHQSQLMYDVSEENVKIPDLYVDSAPPCDNTSHSLSSSGLNTLFVGMSPRLRDVSHGINQKEPPAHIHEVAQDLNEIGLQVQKQYQARIDEIIARAGTQLMVYAYFRHEMNSLLDPMMEHLQSIRLIIYFGKCYIDRMVTQGHNVKRSIMDNTATYVLDIAGDYIIGNGGWVALSEQRSNIPDSEVSPSSCANLSSMNVETLLGSQPDGTNPPPTQNDSNSTFYNIVQFVLFGVAVGLCLFYSRKQ